MGSGLELYAPTNDSFVAKVLRMVLHAHPKTKISDGK